jgi:hypothetical protein
MDKYSNVTIESACKFAEWLYGQPTGGEPCFCVRVLLIEGPYFMQKSSEVVVPDLVVQGQY